MYPLNLPPLLYTMVPKFCSPEIESELSSAHVQEEVELDGYHTRLIIIIFFFVYHERK